MRDHVIAVLQYSIESAGMSYEARPIGCLDQLLDQLVDHLALDPEQVLAPGLLGSLRSKIVAQLVARRLGRAKADYRHIEVEGLHAPFVLRRVDRAHSGIDPHPLEVLFEWQHDTFEFRLDENDLKLERLARFVIDELFAFKGPTGLLQQL